jgi:hypothetical protein
LANTAGQVGGSIALAVYATAAAARAAANHSASGLPEAQASGYELVFGLAAGVALAIAAVSLLLPTHRQRHMTSASRTRGGSGDEDGPGVTS